MIISDLCADDARKMEFLSGDLAPEKRREMERHLRMCPACRGELDDLGVLCGRLRDLRRPKCPEAMVASAIDRLERYEQLGRRFRRARQMALAALGLVALIGTFVLFRGFQIDPFAFPAIPSLSINLEIVRFVVVLVVLSGLPACLDGLGFLLVRRSVAAE